MSILSRLQERAQKVVRRVVTLPIVGDRVLEDPKLERAAALTGAVPKRCGLCRSFNPQDMADTIQMNGAFGAAAQLLSPSVMGTLKGAPPKPAGSEAARALRPDLADRWSDYGGCSRYPGLGVWGFDEEPTIPADFTTDGQQRPCKDWR